MTDVSAPWGPLSELEPGPKARRERLRARIHAEGLSGYLVTRMVNVRYLTGFSGSNGQVLISGHSDADAFITDGRYVEQAQHEVSGLELLRSTDDEWMPPRLFRENTGTHGPRLGVESHDLSWDQADALAERLRAVNAAVQLVKAPHWVETLRRHKDDAELAAIYRACEIADHAFAVLLEALRPGLTEHQVADILETAMRAAGASGPAFATIAASGPHSARPHHRPTDRALQPGDLLKVDFGAVVDGYHSDMTRTVALGDPGPELRAVHELVQQAQQAGRAAAVMGASERGVDAACRDLIAQAGYGEQFVHPTGHGVGLEIHEEPILHSKAAGMIGDRMAVTVEPGVYLQGLGGVRIEDVVVADAQGGSVALSTSPRELIVV